MCTIIVLRGIRDDFPLVIAANRDEMYARASTPPRVLVEQPRIVGGQDSERGGTWMGVRDERFVVAITNQRTYFPADRSRRSRGGVVLAALEAGTVEAVDALLRGLDPREYNPFNLLYGDTGAMHVAYVRDRDVGLEIESLEPGLHVVTNDRIGSPDFPKAQRAIDLVRPHANEPWPALRETLEHTLADHALPDLAAIHPPPPGSPMDLAFAQKLQAICIHTPQYGTHSSTILAFAESGLAEYWFAPGAPSEVAYGEVDFRRP